MGVGKTKRIDVFPYEMTLVIKARACRADVALTPGGGVEVITTGAFVNVTVDVSVLNGDDGKEGGPEDARRLEALASIVLDEELEVVLTRFDEVSPGVAELLPVIRGNGDVRLDVLDTVALDTLGATRELVLLKLVLIGVADDGIMSDVLLLDEPLNARVGVLDDGVIIVGLLVEISDIDVMAILLVELEERLNPELTKLLVDDGPKFGGRLLSRLVEKLDVRFTVSEGNAENVPTTELKLVVVRLELGVRKDDEALGGTRLVESDADRLAGPLGDDPLEIVGTDFVELGAIDTLEEGAGDRLLVKDDIGGTENEDAPGTMLGNADDSVEAKS